MMKRKLWLALTAVLLGLGFSGMHQASASNGAGYTVAPVIPDNQIGTVSSYFNLLVKPGSTQKLTVNIANTSKVVKKLRVSATNAFTQTNGEIGYKPNKETDPSAKHYLKDLTSDPINVTIPVGKVEAVTMTVHVPKQPLTGVILGGIYVLDRTTRQTEGSGMKINNRFALVVGVQLQTTKTAQSDVRPEVKLMSVQGGLQSNKPAVLATLQNPTPTYFGQMDITAKVSWRDQKKTLFIRKVHNYAMAPTSHFAFGIFPDVGLEPGDYALDLLAVSGSRRWHFKKNFTILAADAEKINKAAGVKLDHSWPWWVWVLIAVGVLLLLLIILLLILLLKRRKKDDDEN
ncbi:DUF916 and DUF3324 domain-containing protein [Lacticaseibacillus sharpeae]|uniref:Cell surface protein n=1 Tax=Lacticaseibacillus sharpeae JCM 1186 = DSM 20505 TaxID=1291052 RepID=A0A0R1ZU71_9LACO|nr:DUF916 and DUF3324 domain-containing protein [Lacticaseibacillus sharpeae]KRM55627.1 cell surface protein [Lacticaseibacillus sharpeae JCM 1186 = DSM 20505]